MNNTLNCLDYRTDFYLYVDNCCISLQNMRCIERYLQQCFISVERGLETSVQFFYKKKIKNKIKTLLGQICQLKT